MKKILQILVFISGLVNVIAQSPQIEGDVMLCPWTDGTAAITTNQTYDTYQWYSKYWFDSEPFVAIPDATSASFTYDWFTYDQSLFKVVVTLGNDTYESNEIQIDSYAWTSLSIINDLNPSVSVDNTNGNFLLCPGGSFNNTLNSPYDTNIQWYKDGTAIPGATSISYVITEPGSYYVEAAPSFCPNSSSNNQGIPMIVELDTSCSLNTINQEVEKSIDVYPNPVIGKLNLDIRNDVQIKNYSIIDYSGKVLMNENKGIKTTNISIDVSDLSSGFYILIIESASGKAIKKFIKK